MNKEVDIININNLIIIYLFLFIYHHIITNSSPTFSLTCLTCEIFCGPLEKSKEGRKRIKLTSPFHSLTSHQVLKYLNFKSQIIGIIRANLFLKNRNTYVRLEFELVNSLF